MWTLWGLAIFPQAWRWLRPCLPAKSKEDPGLCLGRGRDINTLPCLTYTHAPTCLSTLWPPTALAVRRLRPACHGLGMQGCHQPGSTGQVLHQAQGVAQQGSSCPLTHLYPISQNGKQRPRAGKVTKQVNRTVRFNHSNEENLCWARGSLR